MGLLENKFSFLQIVRELLKGKSLPRTLLNISLQEVELTGNILDLGSRSSSASYNRFLHHTDPYKITYTDWHQEGEGIIKLDLENSFPIEGGRYEAITCFNVLEHIYNYKNVISESFRVLKPGGIFVGSTPFLVNYHGDPGDYYRYTHESIKKLFTEAGFVDGRIVCLGFGPITAGFSISYLAYPKFIRPLCVAISIFLDKIILKLKPGQAKRYPLGYRYIFRKP